MKLVFKIIIKIIIILIFLLSNISSLSADCFWYISPGLRIGWNLSGNFTVDGKISFGINTDDNLNKITFYNITIGFNALAFAKAKKNQFNEYNYFQLQAGHSFIDDNLLTTGIGVGFIFNTRSKSDFSPIFRLFSGLIIFPELDLIFVNSKQVHSFFGVRAILPIAKMKKLNLGFD